MAPKTRSISSPPPVPAVGVSQEAPTVPTGEPRPLRFRFTEAACLHHAANRGRTFTAEELAAMDINVRVAVARQHVVEVPEECLTSPPQT